MVELGTEDKEILNAAVQLMWKKGTNHPQEAAIAFNFTKLVEKLLGAPGVAGAELFPKKEKAPDGGKQRPG